MTYTLEDAEKEIEKIRQSVKRNNDTVRIDTLIGWFNKNFYEKTITEPAWDMHDSGTTERVWCINKYTGNCQHRDTIDKIIDEIVSLDKNK